MKGQTNVMQEVFVFALSLVVMLSLVIFFRKAEEKSVEFMNKMKLLENGEKIAIAVTKSYITKGKVGFVVDPDVGRKAYNFWYSDKLYLSDGKQLISIPMFGAVSPFVSISERSLGIYFIADSGTNVTRNIGFYMNILSGG